MKGLKMADISTEEFIKTEGQKFLSKILLEGEKFPDEFWNDVLNAPDIAENLKLVKTNDGTFDDFDPGFMIGLSIGARFGMLALANTMCQAFEQL